jgi:hypothetical protein
MPGFMHHNSDRGCSSDRSVQVRALACLVFMSAIELCTVFLFVPFVQCNVRDYDYYGAPYTIISAIATGGVNAVVCDIPARDEVGLEWASRLTVRMLST